jgi:hypothetical protein
MHEINNAGREGERFKVCSPKFRNNNSWREVGQNFKLKEERARQKCHVHLPAELLLSPLLVPL